MWKDGGGWQNSRRVAEGGGIANGSNQAFFWTELSRVAVAEAEELPTAITRHIFWAVMETREFLRFVRLLYL